MSTLARATGIVLRSIRHGETSLILTVFTREDGKVGLMAKGVRAKKKSGTTAAYELFTEAQFVCYRKSGRDLQLLKEASITNAHLPLRNDLTLFSIGSAAIELLMRCSREDDPHPELFDEVSLVLSSLDERPASPLPLLWKFEIALFKTLGFGLQLEACGSSGKLFIPPFAAPIRYRFGNGIFLMPGTNGKDTHDGELSAETFAVMHRLANSSVTFAGKLKVSPRTQRELPVFLARYLETHLSVSGRLHSLDALTWSLST
jgi:DNA repair protein RecO (recombination protein O)